MQRIDKASTIVSLPIRNSYIAIAWFACLLALPLNLSALGQSGPTWQPTATLWDRSLGTHRVVVRVDAPTAAVRAHLEWRRRDRDPEKKAVLVYDLKTGREVDNVVIESISNVAGDILLQPVSGAGEYAVYFLPVRIEGGSFPVSYYLQPKTPKDRTWAEAAAKAEAQLPAAVPVRWEALSQHDAWNAMEVIATPTEVEAAARRTRNGMRVFVTGPEQEVRMSDRLPARWVSETEIEPEPITVQRGEYAVFQVAVWATDRDLHDVRIAFNPGKEARKLANLSGFTCLSTEGVDWNGKPFTRRVDVSRGRVQAFWCGVPIPINIPIRISQLPFTLAVKAKGELGQEYHGVFTLKEGIAQDYGDDNPTSFSRLRWLNSTIAEDDQPTKGYKPLVVNGRTIRCFGREVELNETGLPVRISSYFNPANTGIKSTVQQRLLAGPVALVCELPGGHPAVLKPTGFRFIRQSAGLAEWTSHWGGSGLKASLTGRMEFDGSLRFRIALAATNKTVALQDVRLIFPRTPETTKYVLGLQMEAGLCPDQWEWHWDVMHKNQDSVWLGAVNGGLRVQLKAQNYVMPAINIHYRHRPLNDPPSWSGGGVGGIKFQREHHTATLVCYSGPRRLEAGTPLRFDFDLLVTPFHTLRTAEQWRERYYQAGDISHDLEHYLGQARADGANIINVHQGNWINPYINYPFITASRLRDFSQAAHARGMRVKYYYTVRELSDWCTELFALRSMDDEILLSGRGGGHPWGEEHLGGDYWQAWYEPRVQDVSFLTQTLSRWDNYYVEGLRWLCERTGCDGLYLDDIAYDRDIMLRARKVLDRHCPRGGLIDLHSWNEFQAAGAWAHCANVFMDSLPFVDRLWFGEEHQYAGPPPEHFLVEISGVPFGLMGEMLQGGGNPWLGLVFGCTARLGWQGNPRPVWRLWDGFGVEDSEFIGWWAGPDCPVRCADPMVKISVWKRKDKTLVAIGNFARTQKTVALIVDWKQLGLDPVTARLHAPAMPQMGQSEFVQPATQTVSLRPYGGAAFVLE